VNLPALYNVYNAAGVFAAVTEMGVSPEAAAQAAATFRCGFGRMEKFDLGAGGCRVMLVKNPAGCNQVLRFLSTLQGELELVILLNDNDADGTDVSWIWDVDFELLPGFGERLKSVTVSGKRAWDLFVRLKYAGLAPERIRVETDYDALAEQMSKAEVPLYVMPTYTALLDFRPRLVKRCGGADFWEG
jgi:UDP-N-acetylmuramyl tripeptide synthase